MAVVGYVIGLHSEASKVAACIERLEPTVPFPLAPFLVDPHPDGGVAGCADSHTRLLRRALDRGDSMAVIFEHDCTPRGKSTANAQTWRDLFADTDWQLAMPGYTMMNAFPVSTKRKKGRWHKLGSKRRHSHICQSHGYAVRRRAMRYIVDAHAAKLVPYDMYLQRIWNVSSTEDLPVYITRPVAYVQSFHGNSVTTRLAAQMPGGLSGVMNLAYDGVEPLAAGSIHVGIVPIVAVMLLLCLYIQSVERNRWR